MQSISFILTLFLCYTHTSMHSTLSIFLLFWILWIEGKETFIANNNTRLQMKWTKKKLTFGMQLIQCKDQYGYGICVCYVVCQIKGKENNKHANEKKNCISMMITIINKFILFIYCNWHDLSNILFGANRWKWQNEEENKNIIFPYNHLNITIQKQIFRINKYAISPVLTWHNFK